MGGQKYGRQCVSQATQYRYGKSLRNDPVRVYGIESLLTVQSPQCTHLRDEEQR